MVSIVNCTNFKIFIFLESLSYTVKPVYYGHLGTSKKCPDYQGVLIFQVSLYDKASFGTITKCVDYAGVLIFKCSDKTGFTVASCLGNYVHMYVRTY